MMRWNTHSDYFKPLFAKRGLLLCVVVLAGAVVGAGPHKAFADEALDSKRASLQSQIDALEKEAAMIDSNIQESENQANTLKNEINRFNNEIKQKEIEIKRLTLVITQAALDIEVKNKDIAAVEAKVLKNQQTVSTSIRLLSRYEEDGLLEIMLKNNSLSDFFSAVDNIRNLQASLQKALDELKQDRITLENEKSDLEDFQKSQTDARALQQVEQKNLAAQKKEKDNLLKLTKGKEALYQSLLALKKKDIALLRTQLFYLEKAGITAEDALKYAKLAADRAGIRPAFLLALLEIETGKAFEDGVISVGTNLGTGNWKTDMYDCYIRLGKRSAAEAQKNAFFAITGKLGLDPDQMPVSRRPRYGCGGAMGPAQFIPTTWLLFEARVAQMTGHNPPNPWKIEDAFTASAIFLADAGANLKTTAGELAAART
ncbi:lytic murein transglycosylase, partial [Patescibacteria group bacterium]|nr:lytic murein transglycosylase [Patescibacteria group bacterium]